MKIETIDGSYLGISSESIVLSKSDLKDLLEEYRNLDSSDSFDEWFDNLFEKEEI